MGTHAEVTKSICRSLWANTAGHQGLLAWAEAKGRGKGTGVGRRLTDGSTKGLSSNFKRGGYLAVHRMDIIVKRALSPHNGNAEANIAASGVGKWAAMSGGK